MSSKPISVNKANDLVRAKGYNWTKIKQTYIMDETMTYRALADKFKMPISTVEARAIREGWFQTKQIVQAKAEEKLKLQMIDKVAQIKSRHADIGKFLQSLAIEALKKDATGVSKIKVDEARDALKYIVEGVKIERKAEGIEDQKGPSVVNVINQQQAVMDKYTIKKDD